MRQMVRDPEGVKRDFTDTAFREGPAYSAGRAGPAVGEASTATGEPVQSISLIARKSPTARTSQAATVTTSHLGTAYPVGTVSVTTSVPL
mgnify:CR=1 FL=1